MKEGEEYFKEIVHHNFPTHAMIIKGHWVEMGYGNVWCKIQEANHQLREFYLQHPDKGGFAWVSKDECKFGVKKKFRTTK